MTRRKMGRMMARIVLMGICLIFLAPLAWLFTIAVKSPAEAAAYPTVWWPEHPQWSNFSRALTYIDFLGYTRNSLIIATISAGLGTLSASYVAFGFARLRAPGKKVWFTLLLGTMMLPGIVTTIPLYIMFSKVGLVNTYVPWVLWGLAGSAFNIFLLRQAYMGLPIELEEAAIIDGCGYFRIWWQIYLPLVKAVLAAVFVLAFVWAWGDYFMPMLLLHRDSTTLAVATSSQYTDPMNNPIVPLIAAGSFLFAVPVMIVFFLLQKYFVAGFATSGLK